MSGKEQLVKILVEKLKMKVKLNPCPFCGLQARIRKINDKHYAVTCIVNCAGTRGLSYDK